MFYITNHVECHYITAFEASLFRGIGISTGLSRHCLDEEAPKL